MLENNSNEDPTEKCSSWLKKCSLDSCETESCCSEFSTSTEFSSSSELTNNSAMQSGFTFFTSEATLGNLVIQKTDDESSNFVVTTSSNKKLPDSKIQIYKSKKVHIGDVNYIQGPVYVNGPLDNSANTEKEKKTRSNSVDSAHTVPFHIINRTCWLAQPPVDVEYMEGPAKNVIICHSATEEASAIAENTLLVRLIQSFHVDSRKWWDIAYNFLIGADGSVYEGRGWNVIGSHTVQYNSTSLGICFIGTFMRKKPSANALKKAQNLIEHGVAIGSIDKDYALLGHCQCIGTDSPGTELFEEIKTWKNFDSSISLMKPAFAQPSLKNSNEIFLP